MQIKQLVDMLDASNAELNALTNQTSTERQLFEQETGQLTMEVASLRRQHCLSVYTDHWCLYQSQARLT